MKRAFLFCILSLLTTACFQTENSSSTDANGVEGTPQFQAANAVFRDKCTSCHQHDFHTKTEAQLVAAGKAVKNNPAASPIYYRSKGAVGGPAGQAANMPTDDVLTAGELATIVTWIQAIQ